MLAIQSLPLPTLRHAFILYLHYYDSKTFHCKMLLLTLNTTVFETNHIKINVKNLIY